MAAAAGAPHGWPGSHAVVVRADTVAPPGFPAIS